MRDQEQQRQDDGEDSDYGHPAWRLGGGSQDHIYVGFGTGGKVGQQDLTLFVLFT
jgi:hypothetical protein